jgi:hypothetical protein
MRRFFAILTVTTTLGLAILVAGCSHEGPVGSSDNSAAFGTPPALLGPGDEVQFKAMVQTRDENTRMLTFYGCPDTVIAAHNCEIVRLKNDTEAPIPFSDIKEGDSAYVNGVRQQNCYVLAHRIRVYGDSAWYDVAFRDTIATIDYDAGSFTVLGRTETILVDENTIIWGTIPKTNSKPDEDEDAGTNGGGSAKLGPHNFVYAQDTIFAFTDLEVGNMVEVKAKIVNETTLLAVFIKVPYCNYNNPQCVHFDAHLASVDTDAKLVTFDEYDWIGAVCKGTALIGPEGETLTLADFTAGDYVAVKGVPVTDDTLKVCEMEKLE